MVCAGLYILIFSMLTLACRFTGKYCELRIFLFRPSPQVTQPSPRAAEICYDAAAYIINLSKQQMSTGAVDVTWTFLMNMYTSVNVLLWSVSYPNIRNAHPREEVEELADVTLDILEQCTDRWPGTQAAANLYSVLSRACLQVYDAPDPTQTQNPFTTPAPFSDQHHSPQDDKPVAQVDTQGQGDFSGAPQFGYVFNQQPGAVDPSFSFANAPFPPHSGGPVGPTFRSNSIFFNPSSGEGGGRRFSHFAPDFPGEVPGAGVGGSGGMAGSDEPTPPATTTPVNPGDSPPGPSAIPTPPESVNLSTTMSPLPGAFATPILSQQTPASMISTPHTLPASPLPHASPFPQAQQPLPPAWYAPFPTPFSFPNGGNPAPAPAPATGTGAGVGGGSFYPPGASQQPFASPANLGGPLASPFGAQFVEEEYPRQGSLSFEQRTELMQALESDGLGEIDALLNFGQGDIMW